MSRLARVAALSLLVAGATFVAPASAPAAGSSRAVVNVSGSNHVISFQGSVSGITALQMATGNGAATINYGGQGTAVCSINGVGNPAVPGQCLGEQGDGRYWSYWRASPNAGGFSYSGGGGGGTSVSDGWVEGWNFGNGPPPFSSFCVVAGCAPPPPPPPPVTTPPTAAPPVTSAGGSAAATTDGTNAGDKKSGGSKQSDSGKESDDGKGGGASGSDTGSGTSGGSGAGGSGGGSGGGGRDGQQASGPLVSRPDDGGSPWGVAVAAGAFVALGAGGFYLRKRRRLSVPLE